MSKKLLIAVLLGLLFIYLGNAVAENSGRNLDHSKVRRTTNPNAPEYGTQGDKVIQNHVQRYGRPAGTEPAPTRSMDVLPVPAPRVCDTTFAVATTYYYTTLPAISLNRTQVGQKFTLTAPYNTCSLKVVWVAYRPASSVGSPDMIVHVWDDALGYPGTLLGTVTVPYASLPLTAGYVGVDFSSQNIVLHNTFYVSLEESDFAKVIATYADQGLWGTGSSYVYQGTPQRWYTRAEIPSLDYNYAFGVDKCCIDPTFSECYNLDFGCNIYTAYGVPSTTGTRDYIGMSFSAVGGADTLKDVYVAIDTAYEGDPDLVVGVLPTVAGVPDLSNPIYTTTIPNASVAWYDYNTVTLPVGIKVGNFFVYGGASGGRLYIYCDDGTCGTGACWVYNGNLAIWQTFLARYGADRNFLFGADLCKDMYSECKTQTVDCPPYYVLPLPDGYYDIGAVQPVAAVGLASKLGKVRLPLDVNDVPTGSYNGTVRVYSNDGVGGTPGTLLGSIAVSRPFPDWSNDGHYLQVDFSSQNIRFDGLVYVGFFTDAPYANAEDLYIQVDNQACNTNKLYVLDGSSGIWYSYSKLNFLIQADICSVPVPERTCIPGESWPTSGHDFRRTAASMNSTGDAKCKQAMLWWHTDAAGIAYSRPIIYDTMLIIAYNTKLQGFSINGVPNTPIWSIGTLPVMGSSFRNSVTVKDGFVYFGGGSNKGFSKADVYTGAVIWSRNPLTSVLADATTYTTSVILNQAGTDVVYLSTAGGQVYALDCATGANWGGWATNPIQLDGNPFATLSSDPGLNRIYVGTDGTLNVNGYGTLYAIDAATGVITWQDGKTVLQGVALDTVGTTEEFQSPIAVDADHAIYTVTSFTVEAKDGAPSGVKYRINPDGTIAWAKGFKFGRFAGPVIDANAVYLATIRAWTSENELVEAVKKSSGTVIWQSDPAYGATAWVEGALSCEPGGVPDLLYQANLAYQFLAFNTATGLSEFEYNYTGTSAQARGCGTAIDPTHVVFTNLKGDFFVMQNTANDRPRLRILKFDEIQSVPFFSPNHITVTYNDVFMNNGCANLTGTLSASSTATSVNVTSVAQSRIKRMGNLADQMVSTSYADMAKYAVKSLPVDKSTLDADFQSSPLSKDSYSNKAAYAPPAWLNNIVVSSFNLAAGATFSVQYDVNGPLVTRGPHYCYVTIASNDQYYLNSSAAPEVQLGVLGGCLTSQIKMPFGTTSQNHAPVMSTGEIGNQEDAVFMIDGDSTKYWQGGFFLMASKYRMAWTTDSWHGADPAHYWMSLLPDVNLCGNCGIATTSTPVHLVDISHDGGATYVPVTGNISHVRYIDSVINFNCFGTGWSWANVTCPYDDTLSMGLAVNQWMYGVVGEASLNNVVIYRQDIVNRNATPLTNICLAALNDFDLTSNKNDILKFDAAHSIGYGFSCNVPTATAVYGMGKIPYDKDPMIMTRTIDAAQAMWETNNIGLDSMYLWSSTLTGETWQAGVQNNVGCTPITANDRAQYYTFMKRNFAGNETYKLGTYLFGYGSADGTNAATWANLAILVNQFCGFGRGDINGDNLVNLADVVALLNYVNGIGHGPKFKHLADVNNSGGAPDVNDVIYLANYWFCSGPAPVGDWALPTICP